MYDVSIYALFYKKIEYSHGLKRVCPFFGPKVSKGSFVKCIQFSKLYRIFEGRLKVSHFWANFPQGVHVS